MRQNWKDYMYLVAIPSGELLDEALRIQKLLADSLEIYKYAPPGIHITISTVANLDKQQIEIYSSGIEAVLKKFKPIKLESHSFDCFTQPHKSLVLKIENDQMLVKMQNSLNEFLACEGIFIAPLVDKWIFHITIISELFAESPLGEKDFIKVCQRVALQKSPVRGIVERIELWRPIMNERERVVKIFNLK